MFHVEPLELASGTYLEPHPRSAALSAGAWPRRSTNFPGLPAGCSAPHGFTSTSQAGHQRLVPSPRCADAPSVGDHWRRPGACRFFAERWRGVPHMAPVHRAGTGRFGPQSPGCSTTRGPSVPRGCQFFAEWWRGVPYMAPVRLAGTGRFSPQSPGCSTTLLDHRCRGGARSPRVVACRVPCGTSPSGQHQSGLGSRRRVLYQSRATGFAAVSALVAWTACSSAANVPRGTC